MKFLGIIGCSHIFDQYADNILNFYNKIKLVGCSAAHLENAKKKAEQYGIKAYTTEELLADPAIDMVLILTPNRTHKQLITQALQAGKHVYTEKTLAMNLADAKELVTLANEKGLYLGAAPDTFLGASYQAAREAIDSGKLGEITSFSLNINRCIDFMAGAFKSLRQPGSGFLYDYGVYYLTGLVFLLGPVNEVYSLVKNRAEKRYNCDPMSPDFGQYYDYPNESQAYALFQMESGITGTVSMNGDSTLLDQPCFLIYGTKGIMKLPCLESFGGDVTILPPPVNFRPAPEEKVQLTSPIVGDRRGIGLSDMADAIETGRSPRASKELACHVLSVIEQMVNSSNLHMPQKVEVTCERPEPLTESLIRGLLC